MTMLNCGHPICSECGMTFQTVLVKGEIIVRHLKSDFRDCVNDGKDYRMPKLEEVCLNEKDEVETVVSVGE